MILVDCSNQYWEFIRELRNDPKVLDGFINTSHITEEQQFKYMEMNHADYKVCLFDGEPCGYIGVINQDIRICTHPKFQRKGVGLFMLNEMAKIHPEAIGKVKTFNYKSRALFEAAGYSIDRYSDGFVFFTRR
jgi:RimJ/RimL family protein N-acetyltransferase